jgi:hypothetical protein
MSKTPATTLPACGGAGGPSSGPSKLKKTAIPAARKAAAAAPLPEPEEDGAPSAAAYRLKEEDIDHSVCVGRILKGGKDWRWKPQVYREFQCGKAMEDDCDLCKVCQNRLEKFAEEPKTSGDWNGRVTEDPHAGVHMLDTEWAEVRKPKWRSDADYGSEASSITSEKAVAKAAKDEEKAAAKAAKEAAKKAKDEEKAAAKAAKEAIKRAKNEEKATAKASKAAAPSIMVEEAPAPAPALATDLSIAFSTLVAALKGSGKTVKITIELSS